MAKTKEEIIERLWHDAKYAVNSLSVPLIEKTLGEINIAVWLGAVNFEDVRDIDKYLSNDTLNNPKVMHKLSHVL